MNKKKFVVLALMMIAVIALSSCMFVACNDDNTETPDSTTKIEETEGLLVKNGDFKVVDTTVTSYPRSVTSWTGAKMYSSGSYKDDVTAGAISLDKALYDANKSKWDDDNDELYNLLIAGNRYGDDDDVKNALMVYMPEAGTDSDGKKVHGPTAYGYTSTSFTLEKGKYYKLSVDVLTHKIGGTNEDERGARIYLSSNTYAEFSGIDTNGEWKTYEIVIESSPTSSTSLTVLLGLGNYSASFTSGLTTGYAVFDNFSLVEIEDKADTAEVEGKVAFDNAVEKELANDAYTATATLKVPNGRFDFGSTTLSSSTTPNNWTLVTGNSGKDDSAPTSLGYNAIIDVANFADNYTKYSTTYYTKSAGSTSKETYIPAQSLSGISESIVLRENVVGNSVYMLSQQLMTAQGIKSSRAITIEKNKTYALSVDIYTYGVHGAGVSLILSGGDGNDIIIKGISSKKSDSVLIGSQVIDPDDNGYATTTEDGATTGGWKTYTFYIKGNQYKNYSYNMSVWLGTDGTSDNYPVTYMSYNSDKQATTYKANGTFSNGWVFIDELTLNELDKLPDAGTTIEANNQDQTLDCTAKGKDNYTGLIVDLTTTNMFGVNGSYILNGTTSASTKEGVTSLGAGVPTGWTSNYDASETTNPVIDGIISEGVVNIADETSFNGVNGTYPALPYDIVDKVAYTMHASSDSYYEIESAPITIEKHKSYRISFWLKTVDVKSTSGAYVYVLDKNEDDAQIASFTKINTKDYDEYQNDWCEITLLFQGGDEDSHVSLKFTLGTGNRWATSTLTSGALYIANVNGSEISHSTYSNTSTGTYIKAVDFSDGKNYTFSNGGFDEYDLDDDNIEATVALNEQQHAGMPSSWTFSDNTLKPNTADSKLVAGVIALNTTDNMSFAHSTQTNNVFPNISASVFDNFYGKFTDKNTDLNSYPGNKAHLLAIGSNDGTTGYAAGFSSTSVTLSSNSFYALSVYARTQGNTKATIYLTGESSLSEGSNIFTIESGTSDWTKYTFYIRTGNSSVSVKMNLWLGQNTDYVQVQGATDEEKAENAKSAGAVFFDNVNYTSIDEDAYNSATATATTQVLSFLTDSFDSLSSTIESRAKLTTPDGWSGTVGTNQSSKNTKSGVIYADSNFFETKEIENEHYVGILGSDYNEDDIDITDEELAEAKKQDQYASMTDEAILAALKAKKALDLKKANWFPLSQLSTHSGNQMLVINNTDKSAYTYTSSSFTLKEESYYEVSVWVRTYGLSEGEGTGANIEFYLGSANETDKPFEFTQIRNDEWTEYKFYVKTLDDDVTSATVKLSLGRYIADEIDGETVVTGITSGYAMFDDVTIKKVDEATYDEAKNNEGATLITRQVSTESKGTGDETDNSDSETPSNTFNTEALWWMIPTIVLAVLIIIVLIVYVVRKVRKPIAKKKEKKATKVAIETPSLDAKRDRYDDNKE